MQQWMVIQGTCATEGAEGYPTYGVRMTDVNDVPWEWADVDTDPTVVAVLAHRLQQAQPQRCHFQEMVLDYIEEWLDFVDCLCYNTIYGVVEGTFLYTTTIPFLDT